MSCGTFKRQLDGILKEKKYLGDGDHILYCWVDECRQAIAENDASGAENALDRLTMELDEEEKTIAAAFNRFDVSRTGVLSPNELKFMLSYLGFPNSDADRKMLMSVVDTDGDGDVSFPEFLSYVGAMGGSERLFEKRRKEIDSEGSMGDKEDLKNNLKQAGIMEEAQRDWRLVVAPSELVAAAELVSCQQKAVKHIRTLSKANHDRALPDLQRKVNKMGYADEDLWFCLSWIRELAPIIVHINLDKIGPFLEKDDHYRNQFETAQLGGLMNTKVREKWEKDLFGNTYKDAKAFDRPKYGVQNIWNDYRGVLGAKQYGDSYLVLKDVRLRCTFAPEDSANLQAKRLSVLDFYGHVLNEYSDKELEETLKVCKGEGSLGDSEAVIEKWGKYKEAQIHGEVDLTKHCERLVVNERHRSQKKWVEGIAKKHGFALSWMDDMKEAMAKEGKSGLGVTADEMKARLSKMQSSTDVEDDGECPVGMCIKCRSRPVAPGVTKNGKPFKTCCKGCVMGFGHDITCGKVDASKLGPGLCKMGCGRGVAKGAGGKSFDTCCRLCAKGYGMHDVSCGVDTTGVGPGYCQKACGRKVAPGTTKSGKAFTTCCRGCAMGKGHSPDCIA